MPSYSGKVRANASKTYPFVVVILADDATLVARYPAKTAAEAQAKVSQALAMIKAIETRANGQKRRLR